MPSDDRSEKILADVEVPENNGPKSRDYMKRLMGLFMKHKGTAVGKEIQDAFVLAAQDIRRDAAPSVSTEDIYDALQSNPNLVLQKISKKIDGPASREEITNLVRHWYFKRPMKSEVERWIATPLFQRVAKSLIQMDVLKDYPKNSPKWKPRDLIAALLKVYASLDDQELHRLLKKETPNDGPRRKAWVNFALYSLPLAENADITYSDWVAKVGDDTDLVLYGGDFGENSPSFDHIENACFLNWTDTIPDHYRYTWTEQEDLGPRANLFCKGKLGGQGIMGGSGDSSDQGDSQATYYIFPNSPMARVLHALSVAEVPYNLSLDNGENGPRTLSVLSELCSVLRSNCIKDIRSAPDERKTVYESFTRMYESLLKLMNYEQDSIIEYLQKDQEYSIVQCASQMTYIDLYILAQAWFECVETKSDVSTLSKIMRPLVAAFGFGEDTKMASQMSPLNSDIARMLGISKDQANFMKYFIKSFAGLAEITMPTLNALWYGPDKYRTTTKNDRNIEEFENVCVTMIEKLSDAISNMDNSHSDDSSMPSIIPYISLPLILPAFTTVAGRILNNKARFALTNELHQSGMMVPELIYLTGITRIDEERKMNDYAAITACHIQFQSITVKILNLMLQKTNALDEVTSPSSLEQVTKDIMRPVIDAELSATISMLNADEKSELKAMYQYPFLAIHKNVTRVIAMAFYARLAHSYQLDKLTRCAFLIHKVLNLETYTNGYCAAEIYTLRYLYVTKDINIETLKNLVARAFVMGNVATPIQLSIPVEDTAHSAKLYGNVSRCVTPSNNTVNSFARYLDSSWTQNLVHTSYAQMQGNNMVQRPSATLSVKSLADNFDAYSYEPFVYSILKKALSEATAQLMASTANSGPVNKDDYTS